jgi:hypothetical protein
MQIFIINDEDGALGRDISNDNNQGGSYDSRRKDYWRCAAGSLCLFAKNPRKRFQQTDHFSRIL